MQPVMETILHRRSIRRFEQRMEEVRHFQTGGIRHFGPMILTTLFTLISTGAIGF